MTYDEILQLTVRALNEFEDVPLEVSLRRAVRVATLLGEGKTALRFLLELRPIGGGKAMNIEEATRLVGAEEPARDKAIRREAVMAYVDDRAQGDGMIQGGSVPEMERGILEMEKLADGAELEYLRALQLQREILQRIRMRLFAALCSWERQLTYSNANEQIFKRLEVRVITLLKFEAPDVLDAFNAVYRRLKEAQLTEKEICEELSQASATCRRILKAVADKVFPATKELAEEGNKLGEPEYRNRIREFLKQHVKSEGAHKLLSSSFEDLHGRFVALDNYTNKGVHASMAKDQAELCAVLTFILAGEILNIASAEDEPGTAVAN